jgi:putative ABC transport system permease protein
MWYLWLRRLTGGRLWRALGVSASLALAIALLGSLGAFLTGSFSVMTERAIAGVPVDWQVQIAPQAGPADIARAISLVARPLALERVDYADVDGFSSALRGSVQTTGAGVVVGLAPTYRRSFPSVIRPLVGSPDGVLLAQQTAANLHARVGDRISILRHGVLKVAILQVDGVVDLPFADSFFQAVGMPVALGPQAPPDNVLILPAATWHRLFDVRPATEATTRRQFHVQIAQGLPHDPVSALAGVMTMTRELELKTAGGAIVADNLAAQLASTREDALYARLLFLFLGLPGAVLAAMVAFAVIASGNESRRKEAALLRIRGATTHDVRTLFVVEAVFVALVGVLGGAVLTAVAVRWFLVRSDTAPSEPFAWALAASAAVSFVVIAAYLAGASSADPVNSQRKTFGGVSEPLWRRAYLDWLLLAIGFVAYAKIAATGYQVVVAPEGVLTATVSYDAFLAPLCLWLGGMLVARRLAEWLLAPRGAVLERLIRPFAGPIASTVAATLSRQRWSIVGALTTLGLALSFAISTAVFDATYNAQARVDAELTSGADVTVTIPTAMPVRDLVERIGSVPGVAAAESMQHRFAFVGQDLQDLYAIDPSSLGRATDMSDAYFANGDARATLASLRARPDGVLVSQETVNDFALVPGDRLNLRLQTTRDGRYHPIPFTFAGVVREFPTAPRDSFIVANAAYVTAATGGTGPQTLLIRASSGVAPRTLAAAVRSVVGVPGARVTDVEEAVATVGSSLTSVDLRGLSGIEIVFAVVLAAVAAYLMLALGFAQRRRSHAILAALGASPRQLGAFLWSEGIIVLAGGIVFGTALGFGVAVMLVRVLTGVFDPPPNALTVPWGYLGVLFAATLAATLATIVVSAAAARRDPVRELRR